jgi:carbohydrate kinase (thermoresistant glucokinase family)
MIIILIGPMGCGKTTVGQLLSQQLGWPFYDGDDFHPPANVEKMRKGIPLSDRDRQPWLEKLHDEIKRWKEQNKDVIFACSALKKTYRDALGIDQKVVRSVYLKGSYELIRNRIGKRHHPYMDNGLLKSQMETLEEPEDGLIVDISLSPEHIVQIIVKVLDVSTELRK